MWYGYHVNSTSHLGIILSIGTKNVNVYTNKVLLLFYIFIPVLLGGGGISKDPGVHICLVANVHDTTEVRLRPE
jgi:hypothetical protein